MGIRRPSPSPENQRIPPESVSFAQVSPHAIPLMQTVRSRWFRCGFCVSGSESVPRGATFGGAGGFYRACIAPNVQLESANDPRATRGLGRFPTIHQSTRTSG